ncbi:helix-turn-helix transcriptional regulator [Streptomyces sp. AC536]|uniref:helix-turn-helix domain-containing protein n=1 Tax=Streptomyces buecherae TaxID=2763006 RepID=UPI00164E0492|nr:AraC family transcriptional regulator [Streptomyces buecherae]MBC3984427.1 helix-turn-helix transcriptional regulator [Streptomyces buecherae]QNJ39092.1 helix-turn-helix transcriptional regulator [Streptomyces buecherae]
MSASHIKPHPRCPHGSGTDLDHAVVERSVERAAGTSDLAPPPAGPPPHVLVVHTGRSTNLRWSADGTPRRERFHMGEALVNPAHWASRPRWQDDVELLLLGIEPEWLEKLAAEGGATGKVELVPRYHFTDPLLRTLLERLVAEYAGPGPVDPLYAQSLVQAAAAVVLRVAGQGGSATARAGGLTPRRLAEVVDFIHAHLARRVTLAELAAVAGVSESHFTRAFKASTGDSPHQYVLQRRLEHARRELVRTDRPIAEIAAEAGFADQSHLTRTMRRHDGATPRLLRHDGGR